MASSPTDYTDAMDTTVERLNEYHRGADVPHTTAHFLVGIAILVGCLGIAEAILKSSETIADAIATSKDE
jgi:hypothetical protein